jgi:hypothetical protein
VRQIILTKELIMATKGSNQKTRKADPMRTKNGKERLGPLNVAQLTALKERTSQKKVIAKIQKEIDRRLKNK